MIVDMLIEVNQALPVFGAYLALFPGQPQLQYPLRDLCLEYMDFCIVVVKHLKRNPLCRQPLPVRFVANAD